MARAPISVVPEGFDDAFADFLKDDSYSSDQGTDNREFEDEGSEGSAPDGQGEAADDTEGAEPAGEGDGAEGEAAEGTEDESQGDAGDDAGDEGEGVADGDEGDEGEQTPAAAEKPGDKAAKSDDEDPMSRLVRLLEEREAGQKKEEPQQQKPQKQEEQGEQEIYTDEEKRILEEYQKEWPEVAQAEQLRRRGEYRQIVDYVFNEVAQQLAPLAQSVQAVSERAHLQDLHETVGSDYDVVRDDVVNWVAEQPAYLQPAYQHVIEKGTVEEVADLINRYKTEKGLNQPAQQETPPAEKPRKKKETELPASTKQAAASLAPVSSKRSVVPQGEDPTDFESAFESFAGKL